MIEILLSGLIGALIATIVTIGYTEYKENRDKKINIAREKLEKVYGPLVALKKKIDAASSSGYGFLLPSNPMEKELIEKIIFHHYHLIDDELKGDIFLILPEINRSDSDKLKLVQSRIDDKIKYYYEENKKVLGLK